MKLPIGHSWNLIIAALLLVFGIHVNQNLLADPIKIGIKLVSKGFRRVVETKSDARW
jgi:hypothetical protein